MPTTTPSSGVLVLDYGSQYTQLIARRIRELGVYCEIHPWNKADKALDALKVVAVVLSGGPNTVRGAKAPSISDSVLALNVPMLGICYGMQLIAQQLGGQVERADSGEYGHARIALQPSPLFAGIDSKELDVWMSHGDRVDALPDGFEILAASDNAPIAAMGDDKRRWYGLQFHPEVRHTKMGQDILRNFISEIAGCEQNWTIGDIVEELSASVRAQVGKERVLLGLSGGVDSAVTAALLHKAIGKQLICMFIDNGLLRLNEAEQVKAGFARAMGIELLSVDASAEFLGALKGVSEPEEKRRTIGRVFVEVFEKHAQELKGVPFLAQGTIYSDVIESSGDAGTAHLIKSHHNVGGLPERMNMRLVEPMRSLFKDEVRRLGKELGVAEELLSRHPFPGPGLGVRMLGEINAPALEQLRHADHIFIEELRAAGWYERLSQAFAVFLPVFSVGVAGDARVYAPVIALRAVETDDFMTAHWARLPHDLIAAISARIVNEVKGISRVVYDVSDKPPATIEWE